MTTLFLARHAETIWHAENRYTGTSDIPLSDHGYRQAEQLAQWSQHARLDAIYSSPLTRCTDTAAASSRSCAMPTNADPRLREVGFGRGEGHTRKEMAELFPNELAGFLAAPGTTPLPDGEPGLTALTRSLPALNDICTAHPNGRALVVMHATLLRLILCELLAIPINNYRQTFPTIANCALTTIDLTPWPAQGDPTERCSLLTFNLSTDGQPRTP